MLNLPIKKYKTEHFYYFRYIYKTIYVYVYIYSSIELKKHKYYVGVHKINYLGF